MAHKFKSRHFLLGQRIETKGIDNRFSFNFLFIITLRNDTIWD